MKSNIVPDTYVALCSSNGSDGLVRLNFYLRTHGIDARFVPHSRVGPVIKVPPDQHKRAGELRDAWLEEPTDVLDDYAKIKAQDAGVF